VSIQKKASKAILQYLAESGRVRTEKLRKAICNPPPEGKNICTPKMFYQYLANLVELKRVKKFDVSRNEVYYSTPDWVEYENEVTEDKMNHALVIQNDLKKIQSVTANFDVDYVNIADKFSSIFMEIMYMRNWATLAQLRNPKEDSPSVDNILTGTVPDLLELFSTAIGKFEKDRVEMIEDLMDIQRTVVEGGRTISVIDRLESFNEMQRMAEEKKIKKA